MSQLGNQATTNILNKTPNEIYQTTILFYDFMSNLTWSYDATTGISSAIWNNLNPIGPPLETNPLYIDFQPDELIIRQIIYENKAGNPNYEVGLTNVSINLNGLSIPIGGFQQGLAGGTSRKRQFDTRIKINQFISSYTLNFSSNVKVIGGGTNPLGILYIIGEFRKYLSP